MNTLTKEQVKDLEPGQQEALGLIEARRVGRQARLLSMARGSRARVIWVTMVTALPLFFLAYFLSDRDQSFQTVIFPLGGAIIFAAMHVGLLNQRLDAIVELLEEQIKDSGPD